MPPSGVRQPGARRIVENVNRGRCHVGRIAHHVVVIASLPEVSPSVPFEMKGRFRLPFADQFAEIRIGLTTLDEEMNMVGHERVRVICEVVRRDGLTKLRQEPLDQFRSREERQPLVGADR